MKTFKASLIATGVGAALALALSGPAFAYGGGGGGGGHSSEPAQSGNWVNGIGNSAVATDDARASYTKLGDVDISFSMSAAETTLNGTVQNNGSDGIDGNSGGNGGGGGSSANGAVGLGLLALAKTGNGAGGNGGAANGGDAGSFVVSNSIANSSFRGAAGIMNVNQNTGANALTQQGVTVQANLGGGLLQ